MNENDFESWFVPTPRRLNTLDKPPHTLRLLSVVLFGLACFCGIAWMILK